MRRGRGLSAVATITLLVRQGVASVIRTTTGQKTHKRRNGVKEQTAAVALRLTLSTDPLCGTVHESKHCCCFPQLRPSASALTCHHPAPLIPHGACRRE